jgi:hypothetical protein
MNPHVLTLFIRRNPMNHDLIVEQLFEGCKWFMETILQAPNLHHVGSASLAIFTQRRQVAWEMLQAKITLEAHQLKSQDIPPIAGRPA